MKNILIALLLVSLAFPVHADEEKLSRVHKIFDLPGVFNRDGVLQESIGVETLAGISSPVLKAGQTFPASAKMKFGISSDCQCARFRLFRMPEDKSQPPVEISYDAVRGFSKDNKTLEVLFEITRNRKVKLSVEVDQAIAPGQLLEWVPASEIVPLPQPPIPEAIQPHAPPSKTDVPEAVVTEDLKAISHAEVKTEKLTVASEQVDCVGVAPKKCLSVQREGKSDWELFYDSIQGFEYEPGFDYVVTVKVSPVENPPADASSLKYELVEVVSKTPVVADVSDEEKSLHDIWVLVRASAESLNRPEISRKPVLEIYVKEQAFMGQAPCNNYSGGIKLEAPSAIRFEAPAATRMACPDLNAEADFFRLLESVEHYRREGNELILVSGDLEVLRFKKAD